MSALMRLMPQSWLFKYSLWDECDGEPMNAWADELVRRDGFMAAALGAKP